jgi:endogenous inhibitor of DNA gyrase (YacG/DUF329 family)
LIDLGAWLTEQRAIPNDSAAAQDGAAAKDRPPKGST